MNKLRNIMTSLVALLLIFAISTPVFADGVKGNGKLKTEVREVSDFSGIKVSGAYTIYLTQDENCSLKVVADENVQDLIKTEVRNEVLYIKNEDDIHDTKKMELYIGFKYLRFIKASGAISLKNENSLKFDELEIEINGASSAKLELTANKLSIDNSGASSISLKGSAKELNIDISGAGSVNAVDLKASEARIDISGVGTGKVYVEDKLKVSISGIGSVKYKGDPKVTSDISFLGVLRKL
ncbi:DUF2807 domain-containing protein [Ancylomarina euxinus]|uniref:DUF2807 domain-containing protein n=1 Tax=Ancylomarina euxinus TaxID=2283627 RepID=A0A425Y7A4_9BACT|nr:head GIN domain-containing protein [Ancylomarina euxinus]MCZ4693700.1 DUF2807 domain-containing protein [Ancylomarina euxinus]MUP13927.1 hypothetical protein [Ancylomarina euxinus]RRG24445.1 DUF2807 domain-containing protein [Ancylomarina euxinus]